jgi:chromosome segregation ATPase
MNIKEQLQELKNKLEKARGKRGVQDAIYAEYGDWLISQAEKVEQLQQEVDRLSQENISWQKHDARQEAKIHNLEMKIGKLKQLGDPTL